MAFIDGMINCFVWNLDHKVHIYDYYIIKYYKTDRHDITEIMLKVTLNTIILTLDYLIKYNFPS